MKKLLHILTITLLLGASHQASGQQVYFEYDGIVYGITSESDRTAEVLPYYYLLNSMYSGSITIPQTVEHEGTVYTVTALGNSAFESNTNVTSLNLPATIRSIGAYCFYNCRFTTLQLPDSLRSIGDQAFIYSSVTSLHLPAHFEEYSGTSFWATRLTGITVDESNPHYRSIDGWLFSKDSLTLCIVPSGVTGTINVPSFVRHIGSQAFGFNSSATSVSLPEGLVSIGDFAFNICHSINNVVIPSSVTSIGLCPFSYCPRLTNLSIAPGNTHYVLDGLMLYSSDYDTLVSCHKSGATVTLNPNLKVLGGFENNTWVRNIDIPDGVTDISDNCFNGCLLSSIALPAHMNSIGNLAFASNYYLSNVTMPQTLLSMGEEAFEVCITLNNIVIPDSLRVIPKMAFNSCLQLNNIVWGNAVEEIGEYAFWAKAAETLDLPPTLRKIDEYAFAAVENSLRVVLVNSQLDTMGEGAFDNANLDYIRFITPVPPAVTGLGPLNQVSSIDSIVIPCGCLDAWLADSYWGQFADLYVENCNAIDQAADNHVAVFPNPAADRLTIQAGNGCHGVELVNMAGQTVVSSQTRDGRAVIDVSGLSRGSYIVRILTPDGPAVQKVILQ